MNQNTIISLTRPLLASLVGAACIGTSLAELSPIGSEFSIATSLPGDQINSKIAMGGNGGVVIWEGNALDGHGQGISAVRLNNQMEPAFEPFVVNGMRDGNQERPDVALSGENGAVFVWEGNGNIYARLLNEDGTMSDEQVVNTFTEHAQRKPAITVMDNGNTAIVWESEEQDGDRLGVFGQVINQDGNKIGPEFSLPQNSFLNQRSPSVVSTSDGGFMAVWVSEAPVGGFSGNYGVSVWGRYFHYDGSPKGDEFQLTKTDTLASNPALAMNNDGDIALVFSGRPNPAFQEVSLSGEPDNWAVFSKLIRKDGTTTTTTQISNNSGNDQAVPVIASNGTSFIVSWTGFGGEGKAADVYGTMLDAQGNQIGSPSFVNTNQKSLQYMPSLTSTSDGNYLAVWSSFVGGSEGFDLKALKFDGSKYGSGVKLDPPQRPFVFGLGFNEIGISWSASENEDLAYYEVYVDGSQEPIVSHTNYISLTDLPVDSRHTVSLAVVHSNGSKSSASEEGEGKTWAKDENSDGLPDTFQQTYWGFNPKNWDNAQHDSDQDGLTNLEELLAGTNPLNARSVLKIGMEKADDAYWLVWDTNPGAIYQIQSTGNLESWSDATGPKVADDFGERLPITASEAQNIYRVVRLK